MALFQIAEPGESAAPHEHKLAIGIDLGTTNSLVATVRSGISVVLNDEQGRPLLPSIVRYREDGTTEVGYDAQTRQAVDPKNTIENLPTLGKRLTLPKGWNFRARKLDKEMTLTSTADSNPPNTIVLDEFEDNYQYNAGASVKK